MTNSAGFIDKTLGNAVKLATAGTDSGNYSLKIGWVTANTHDTYIPSESIHVNAKGDVGLGVIPTGKLDLFGNVKVRGKLLVDGTIDFQGGVSINSQLLISSDSSWVSSIAESESQQASTTIKGKGFIQTPWIYSSVIEAPKEKTTDSTMIVVGQAGLPSFNDNFDKILLVTHGEEQLTVATNGDLTIDHNLGITQNLTASGDATLKQDVSIEGSGSSLFVTGNMTVAGKATIKGDLTGWRKITIKGETTVEHAMKIEGS